jgi:hypothetical protein
MATFLLLSGAAGHHRAQPCIRPRNRLGGAIPVARLAALLFTAGAVPGSARESPPRGERVGGRASRTAPSIKSLLCPARAKDWPLYGRYEGRLSYH